MQLHKFENVQKFWQIAQNYLLQFEAEHNALLGILQTLLYYPDRYPQSPYLALVQTGDQIQAVALRTPPRHLLLSKVQDWNALEQIAQDLQQEQLPGVSGLVAEVEMFAQIWQTLTGQSCQLDFESRIYQLTQVEPVAVAGGFFRLATEADRPLLLQWMTDFDAMLGVVDRSETERGLNVQLQRQSLYLWEDGVPVSLAGGRLFSATAARIAPVYTPPEHRRKGYATACVAALSQHLLNQGIRCCYLFADLANPTSNSIYQQIGYRPVCDWREYIFSPEKHELG